MIWLGIQVDFIKNTFSITEKRINSLVSLAKHILTSCLVPARKISKLAGAMISTT